MSGYKRVNFYELCRLCATNQQKEKTHIFQEEGRKIQLQNKIQNCLSLKVCENDFLPKVVCSKCLRSLEECCIFRKECYTSETMLSSYFNNFRYTEDFKKSGKVYIKDTSPKVSQDCSVQTLTGNNNNTTQFSNVNVIQNVNGNPPQENVPYYALQLPTVLSQTQEVRKEPKTITQPQIVYNLNSVKTIVPVPKTNCENINNVAVNSNGDIIAITTPLVDVDALLPQNLMQRIQRKIHRKHQKPIESTHKSLDEGEIIKIDLTQPNVEYKRENTLEKLKLQQNKVTYSVKFDQPPKPLVLNTLDINRATNHNQSVVLNPSTRLNTVPNINVNRMQKTYLNFNNMTVNNNMNIASITMPAPEPALEPVNLNPEPPPALTHLSSTFNQTQNLHYSMSNCKPDMECNISATTELSSLFGGIGLTNNVRNVTQNFTNLNQSFTSSTSVSVPINNQSQSTNSFDDSTPKQENIKNHSCDVCCKTFKRREHLYQHVKLHTGFRPFKCENCNKSFMRKEHLLRHMTSHSGLKNFTCTICDKSFSRNDNLLKHKKIHNKQNSFTCEICQKQFVMEHYYYAHKRTHDSDKSAINQVWGLLKAA